MSTFYKLNKQRNTITQVITSGSGTRSFDIYTVPDRVVALVSVNSVSSFGTYELLITKAPNTSVLTSNLRSVRRHTGEITSKPDGTLTIMAGETVRICAIGTTSGTLTIELDVIEFNTVTGV